MRDLWSVWVDGRLWVTRDGAKAWRGSHARRRARMLRRNHGQVDVRPARDEDVAPWQRANRNNNGDATWNI